MFLCPFVFHQDNSPCRTTKDTSCIIHVVFLLPTESSPFQGLLKVQFRKQLQILWLASLVFYKKFNESRSSETKQQKVDTNFDIGVDIHLHLIENLQMSFPDCPCAVLLSCEYPHKILKLFH